MTQVEKPKIIPEQTMVSQDEQTNDLLRRLSEFRSTASDAHTSWVNQAALYVNEGFINKELLPMLMHQMHWHSIAEKKWCYDIAKFFFDFAFTLVLILLYAPIFLFCMLAVKLTSKGPIFYKQLRMGRYGRPFWIYKFRTMYEGSQRKIPFISDKKGPMLKYKDDPRITPVGRLLRERKFDELPQLFNILKGDMSLVGPRPLTPCDSATTPPEYLLRFAVRPGLTGLWQATDNSLNDGLKKVQLDCEYVKKRDFIFDLKLLVYTIPVAIMGEQLDEGSPFSRAKDITTEEKPKPRHVNDPPPPAPEVPEVPETQN